jgi:hypothetical protein
MNQLRVAGDSTPGLLPEARSPDADARRSRFEGSQHLVRAHGRERLFFGYEGV